MPRSLADLCRVTIRRSICFPKLAKPSESVQLLPIPQHLQDYIGHAWKAWSRVRVKLQPWYFWNTSIRCCMTCWFSWPAASKVAGCGQPWPYSSPCPCSLKLSHHVHLEEKRTLLFISFSLYCMGEKRWWALTRDEMSPDQMQGHPFIWFCVLSWPSWPWTCARVLIMHFSITICLQNHLSIHSCLMGLPSHSVSLWNI